ncbi:MAG: MFS transporter [Verrucomicrobia bacterium]|jgi:fucose permease|nr:MFS transporter [Verrucomicrobiota bacterium]
MSESIFSNAKRSRLFAGICLALIPTGASFGLIANVMTQLKTEFLLTNAQVGTIAGAAIWGMAISLLVIGPMLEKIGMKVATWLAFIGHLAGLSFMISAAFFGATPEVGFWLLMFGAILLAGGNGMIEVAGNPLTAALYPKQKTHKLNIFHAFFPLAILVAGVVGFGLSKTAGLADGLFFHWTFQLAIIYVPIIIYGLLVLPLKFPKTENAEAGLPVKEMFRYTLTSPFMYAFLLAMAIAIGLELGVTRWIAPIFGAIGMPGALMMSWIALVMMLLRFFSGSTVGRFSPVGLLALCSIFMSLGLFLFANAGGSLAGFIAATLFGIGVAFNFPTIVGLVSERLPKTGSLGIVLTAGFGLLAAGAVGTPGIGAVADRQLGGYLEEEKRAVSLAVLEGVQMSYPERIAQAQTADDAIAEFGFVATDLETALDSVQQALDVYSRAGNIAGRETPIALRVIGASSVRGATAELSDDALALLAAGDAEGVANLAASSAAASAFLANSILGPAEGVAGQRAIGTLAWIPLILTLFFGSIYFNDRKRGGYKPESLDR